MMTGDSDTPAKGSPSQRSRAMTLTFARRGGGADRRAGQTLRRAGLAAIAGAAIVATGLWLLGALTAGEAVALLACLVLLAAMLGHIADHVVDFLSG